MSQNLENVINFIRDILRKEGITGIDSVYHCIVFIISKMLDKNLCNKLNINEKYTYENIMKDDDDGSDVGNQDLYNKIYNGTKNCLVGEIMFKMSFKNIKFKLNGVHNLRLIYDKINELDIKKLDTRYDIIGTIYELHLRSGTSHAMRDLGQYYTNRLVIEYMIKLCDPKKNKNGIIEKIADPTMGTGGFLTMAIRYLKNKYNNDIDWELNKDNIIGFDIDDNVKNMGLLNILLETGEFHDNTICNQDTLYNDMKFRRGKYDDEIVEHADIILANEPMGLKNIKYEECCDRIRELKIKGTKAEPLFLQLFMTALNKNGRCAVIVPDGVLFNESAQHKGTRKYLIENFNLQKVIALNDDFFLNTGVKTSILFFSNDNKTKEVNFCEIKIKNGEIEENNLVFVDYEKIKENKYSLFINKYNTIDIEKFDGIQYKKLGELLKKKNGKSLPKKDMKEGIYPVITGGIGFGGYHNEFNYNERLIFIARVGTAGSVSKYEKECFVTDLVGAYKVNDDVLFEYVYYYLKQNENFIKTNYIIKTGAPSINLTNFLETYQIPVPHVSVQEAIVKKLELLSNNIERSKQMIDEYGQISKYYVDVYIKESCNFQCKKLGEICFIKLGKRIKKCDVEFSDEYDGIKYPCYGGGDVSFYTKEFNREGKNIIISRFGVSEKCVRIINKKFWLNDSGFTIHSIDDKILLNDYLGYYCYVMLQSKIFSMSSGACQKNLQMDDFKNIEIPIPQMSVQITIIEKLDLLSENIERSKQMIDNNKKLMKNIMNIYLNDNNKNVNCFNDNSDNDEKNSIKVIDRNTDTDTQ